MNGNHPKRRRDKYNPYHIYELEGHYYISFQDGQGILQEFEITQTLSPVQRRRLISYFYEGMTYEQIAEKEGCTKMPVKRSIDAALGKLKKELKNLK